jgi:uncharacterized lipoprotein
VLGALVIAVLAECGTQSRVVQRKPLTPSEAMSVVKSIKPECHKPGHVLIHYTSPSCTARAAKAGGASNQRSPIAPLAAVSTARAAPS